MRYRDAKMMMDPARNAVNPSPVDYRYPPYKEERQTLRGSYIDAITGEKLNLPQGVNIPTFSRMDMMRNPHLYQLERSQSDNNIAKRYFIEDDATGELYYYGPGYSGVRVMVG